MGDASYKTGLIFEEHDPQDNGLLLSVIEIWDFIVKS